MHSEQWPRRLTERQRQVLSVVVENRVYRNRDSGIAELAADLGVAPTAVLKHLLRIEEGALLHAIVTPSEQGKRVYERLQLRPTGTHVQVAEVLEGPRMSVLRFLRGHPDATATEVQEELELSEYATLSMLRTLTTVSLVEKRRRPAIRRGSPPYVYRLTRYGLDVHDHIERGRSSGLACKDGDLGSKPPQGFEPRA